MHERPLVDRVYDHYCYGELSAYSRGVEDLLSFLSLPHTRRELQEGDLSDGSYQEWCNSKQCIFTNGSKETIWVNDDEEAEELGEEDALEEAVPPDPKRTRVTKAVQLSEADMVKAEFLALVLMRHSETKQGVLMKNSVSGQWNEDPAIVETFSEWTVMNVKAKPPKAVHVFKLAGALTLDFQHQSRPWQAKTGQSITLSPVASAIAKLTFKGVQDVVQTLLSVLPKRQKDKPARFQTSKAKLAAKEAADAAERTRKRGVVGPVNVAGIDACTKLIVEAVIPLVDAD